MAPRPAPALPPRLPGTQPASRSVGDPAPVAPPAQLARDCVPTEGFAGPEASSHGGDRVCPSVCPGSMAQLPSSSRRAPRQDSRLASERWRALGGLCWPCWPLALCHAHPEGTAPEQPRAGPVQGAGRDGSHAQQARARSHSGTRAALPCIPRSRSLLPARAGRRAGPWGCVPPERHRLRQKGAGDGN